MSTPAKTWQGPAIRLALDLGPLILFFVTFEFYKIYVATGVFMAAVLTALLLGYLRERRVLPMPLLTAVLVLIFGSLTIYLHNDVFIKVKQTILYGFFGATLLGGLAFNKVLIRHVFEQAFDLTQEGWRKLSLRWGIFFLLLAIANEIVWRNFPTNIWVDFKVWGIIPLIFLFGLLQTPLIMKYEIKPESDAET